MEEWANFYVAIVGAAGALAGLIVVAISINISKILDFASLPSLAAHTVATVAIALVLGCLALFPHQSTFAYGIEAFSGGASVGAFGLRRAVVSWSTRKPDDPWIWRFSVAASAALSSLPYVIGGAALVLGMEAGLYWVAVGVVLGFIVTLQNGWVLLIEILR